MPMLHLLPLGTIIKGKTRPGWEQFRLMVTGYYPREKDGPRCNDYTVTPWPLGYLNFKDGSRELFLSCNESAIVEIEFLGAVDDASKRETDRLYGEALGLDGLTCPLAQGAEPMAHAYGELPCTIGDAPFAPDEILPLGSVVSTERNGKQKAMIFQHSGTYRNEHYDYGICAWPEGADPGSEDITLIKRSEITAVHFRGYENAVSQQLAKQLERKRRGSLFTRIFGI